MTNDITTIAGAAQEVIDNLEQHLYDKGVLDATFNPSTGILGLVNRIPDIEPSVNINLTIDLSLTCSESHIYYGESILLTATLLASYEGVSEVDLQTGEITGATIIFKNGSTVIGTGTTDNNGVATLNYTPTISDTTLSINAVFDGTDNFNQASSSNVSVEVTSYLNLTGDKSILSYKDGDSAILTATYYGANPTGRTITLYDASDDSIIGVMADNNDGTYSYTYQSQGVGDLEIYAKILGGLVSETYEVEDCRDYQALTSNVHQSKWSIPSAVSSSRIFGYSSDGWEYGNASSYSSMYLEEPLTAPLSIEFTLTEYYGQNPSVIFIIAPVDKSTYQHILVLGNNQPAIFNDNIYPNPVENGATYKLEAYSNELKVYKNNNLLATKSFNTYNPFLLRLDTGNNRYCRIKDLKIKPL